ncbi:hypothetical protein [Sinorhizobium meliloti]|uniref:hypothetical protein n=1 Tax=Rhizobium meliloti TaxID=382 RepID=UPI000FD72F14|nr:hypothetical protein [Sinorhizobium meliloti]RVG66931.1 hypothetical protein CN220_22705 [Sinorhizobium meliloti]RVH45809.1 hypothetical protein CN212_22515 [Sinorhizobium meliloti]RVO66609.1 hypothetical protein CN087_17940 [Sinorhizobium meliloti]
MCLIMVCSCVLPAEFQVRRAALQRMFSPVEIDFKPQTHAFFAGFQIRLSPLEEKKGPAGERDEEKCARFSARIPRLNF